MNSRPLLVGCSVGEWTAAGHNARVRFVDDACSSSTGDSIGSAVTRSDGSVMASCASTDSSDASPSSDPPLGAFIRTDAAQ